MRHAVKWRSRWDKVYWAWRFSVLSRPYYALKTFLHLHLNARKTAIVLDDVMRAMGQMNHPSRHKVTCRKCGEVQVSESKDSDCMLMPIEERSKLVHRGYWHALPNGWKWRKD